jgi:ribosome-associated heat shock protein Hsp15
MSSRNRKQSTNKADSNSEKTLEVRLDKWLQVARIFKTRSQADDAIDGGLVKMDGKRAKAGRIVKINDEIEVSKKGRKIHLKVLGVAPRPIPAAEASLLFEQREEADRMEGLNEEQRDYMRTITQLDRSNRDSRKGRPSKKDRRDMDRVSQERKKMR